MSKVAEKTKRMRRTVFRLSSDIRISLVTDVRGVSVEWFFLSVGGLKRICFWKCVISWEMTACSSRFEM